MEYFSEEIVANIKHEQEENFIFDLSAGDKVSNVDRRELKIILKPFDDNWKSKAEKSVAYFVCTNCNFVDRQRNLICLQCKTNHETIFHDSKHLNEFGVKQEPDENSIYLPAFSPDLIGNPPTVKKESVGEEIMELKKKVEKAIICKYCDLKFPSCSDRKIHVAQVHNNWQCSQCPYKAQSKIYLTQHSKTHNRKFTCESCGQKFTKPRGLTSHQMQHRHGVYANKVMRKFKCENCKSSFATAKGLNDHNRNVHRKISGNFQCDMCGRTFKSRQCLRSHVQRHFKIPCLVCQHLMSRERLKDHMEENHSFKVSQCDICGKSFRSFKKLQQHTLSVHKVQKVQCDFCGKFCRNKTLLRQHVLVHVQVSCSFCGKLIKKIFPLDTCENLSQSN